MKKLLLLAWLCLALTGCKKNAESVAVTEIEPESKDHHWYYFTNANLVQIHLPQVSKLQSLKPWTENLRVSDANTDQNGNGFLLVNRLGMLIFEGGAEGTLVQDVSLFGENTAESLVFDGGTPYFALYRNTFFNQSTKQPSFSVANRPYLVRVSTANRMLYPTLTYGDLGISGNSEILGSVFDGTNWLASIKTTDDERTEFAYKQWTPQLPLEAMQPSTKEGKLTISAITEEDYRAARTPERFANAPLRLKSLLAAIPPDFDFSVTCKTAGGFSPRTYNNGEATNTATAIIADGWICATFADGTTYFNGALKNHEVIANGNTVAFRLPKLPKDYFYTDFCISGDFFVVGWEESNFYKTGRSGILVVDLGTLLYKS